MCYTGFSVRGGMPPEIDVCMEVLLTGGVLLNGFKNWIRKPITVYAVVLVSFVVVLGVINADHMNIAQNNTHQTVAYVVKKFLLESQVFDIPKKETSCTQLTPTPTEVAEDHTFHKYYHVEFLTAAAQQQLRTQTEPLTAHYGQIPAELPGQALRAIVGERLNAELYIKDPGSIYADRRYVYILIYDGYRKMYIDEKVVER